MASGQGNQAHGGVTAEKHRVDTVFARTGYAGHSRKNTRLSHGVGKSRHGHRPRVEPKGARGLRTPAEVAQFRSSPQKKGHIVDIGGVMTWQVSLNQANQFLDAHVSPPRRRRRALTCRGRNSDPQRGPHKTYTQKLTRGRRDTMKKQKDRPTPGGRSNSTLPSSNKLRPCPPLPQARITQDDLAPWIHQSRTRPTKLGYEVGLLSGSWPFSTDPGLMLGGGRVGVSFCGSCPDVADVLLTWRIPVLGEEGPRSRSAQWTQRAIQVELRKKGTRSAWALIHVNRQRLT